MPAADVGKSLAIRLDACSFISTTPPKAHSFAPHGSCSAIRRSPSPFASIYTSSPVDFNRKSPPAAIHVPPALFPVVDATQTFLGPGPAAETVRLLVVCSGASSSRANDANMLTSPTRMPWEAVLTIRGHTLQVLPYPHPLLLVQWGPTP
jgi:hypothetical protein